MCGYSLGKGEGKFCAVAWNENLKRLCHAILLQACNACKAFSVIAILLGAFGLAASIHIHEVFASFTKARSAACIAGASLSCLLTIAIWEGGIMKSGTGVDQGSRRESYALFVLGCLLYMASTVALARSTTVTVGPAGSTTV
eukprot:m.152972 g.152972  ORF g.152972 m.152972 type:complete len:142 (+) comp17903_c0_seq1:860-1285(+)